MALNFQTPGEQMDLLIGKFLDNGGSGYVLKPEFLRRRDSAFDPFNVADRYNPITLTIKVRQFHGNFNLSKEQFLVIMN